MSREEDLNRVSERTISLRETLPNEETIESINDEKTLQKYLTEIDDNEI